MEFETSLACVILRIGAGEMAQQVKALVAPAEDLGVAPFTHTSANNYLELQDVLAN